MGATQPVRAGNNAGGGRRSRTDAEAPRPAQHPAATGDPGRLPGRLERAPVGRRGARPRAADTSGAEPGDGLRHARGVRRAGRAGCRRLPGAGPLRDQRRAPRPFPLPRLPAPLRPRRPAARRAGPVRVRPRARGDPARRRVRGVRAVRAGAGRRRPLDARGRPRRGARPTGPGLRDRRWAARSAGAGGERERGRADRLRGARRLRGDPRAVGRAPWQRGGARAPAHHRRGARPLLRRRAHALLGAGRLVGLRRPARRAAAGRGRHPVRAAALLRRPRRGAAGGRDRPRLRRQPGTAARLVPSRDARRGAAGCLRRRHGAAPLARAPRTPGGVVALPLVAALAACLAGVSTWAAGRWGHEIGGILSAFPLIVGPVLLLGAQRHGTAFAADAAGATLAGLVALSGFALAYGRSAVRWSWRVSLAAGWCAAAALGTLAGGAELGLAAAVAAAAASIVAARAALPPPAESRPSLPLPAWEPPVRMGATVLLI